MASFKRLWASLRDAVREDGLPGLADLVQTRAIALRCRAVIREMMQQRQAVDEAWNAWMSARTVPDSERRRQRLDQFTDVLSILIPTHNTNPDHLAALADSITAQTCSRWEVCFYDGASTNENTRSLLRLLARRDPRFRVEFGEENLGISGNTNKALAMAGGSWIALCDHDDLLAPEAVWCILRAAAEGADMVYTDEDKCDEAGTRFFDPHLKEDFAPDSLRSGNYICHFLAMKASLIRSLGGLRAACDGSQDHDLALRASEQARRIVHIPRVLYHWRMLSTSYSHERAARCADAAALAVQDHLDRLGIPAQVDTFRRRVRIRYEAPENARVTLVVSNGGSEGWLQEVLQRTGYPVAEIIRARADQLDNGIFRASGEYLAFIAWEVLPGKGWLRELLSYARREDVACAGGVLTDRRQCYLHAGYAYDRAAGCLSLFYGQCRAGFTYQLKDRLVRNVSGVSSALMCIRRDVFLRLGGFGPWQSDIRGLSLGLRGIRAGLCNVIIPQVRALAAAENCLNTQPSREEVAALLREVPPDTVEHYYPRGMDRLGMMTMEPHRLEVNAP